jgi:hypothetical protein
MQIAGMRGLVEMTPHVRRKSEFARGTNERDFPHLVELVLPLEASHTFFQEIDAFHRERQIPVTPRPEPIRGQAILHSILLSRWCHCRCIPQSFRWRVLDAHTGETQLATSAAS